MRLLKRFGAERGARRETLVGLGGLGDLLLTSTNINICNSDHKVLPEIMENGLQLQSGFPTLAPRQPNLVYRGSGA